MPKSNNDRDCMSTEYQTAQCFQPLHAAFVCAPLYRRLLSAYHAKAARAGRHAAVLVVADFGAEAYLDACILLSIHYFLKNIIALTLFYDQLFTRRSALNTL